MIERKFKHMGIYLEWINEERIRYKIITPVEPEYHKYNSSNISFSFTKVLLFEDDLKNISELLESIGITNLLINVFNEWVYHKGNFEKF